PPLPVTPVGARLWTRGAPPHAAPPPWSPAAPATLPANVYRRANAGDDWAAIGQLEVPASGQIVFADNNVTAGARFQYRIGIVEGGVEKFFGDTWVDVPNYVLAIASVAPNPAARDMWVSFTL